VRPDVSPSLATRYRFDDLRRFAASLIAGLGVSAPRASVMASHLLWFDAAGASSQGISTLPTWLHRLDRKEIDPVAEGRSWLEHAGTAVVDGRGGLAPLILEKAAGIAAEKARDVGVGIVRVHGLGPSGPVAPVVAELAIGPFIAMIAGPGPSMAVGLPMPEGLPSLYDSALEVTTSAGESSSSVSPGGIEALAPWITAIAGSDDGWSILALSVSAMEPLSSFHRRVATLFRGRAGSGYLTPGPWEARRREVRGRGITLDGGFSDDLRTWTERLEVPWPSPLVD
jgi:LDH2 family malate/lactate/ureidoglycolate dehydrogenase